MSDITISHSLSSWSGSSMQGTLHLTYPDSAYPSSSARHHYQLCRSGLIRAFLSRSHPTQSIPRTAMLTLLCGLHSLSTWKWSAVPQESGYGAAPHVLAARSPRAGWQLQLPAPALALDQPHSSGCLTHRCRRPHAGNVVVGLPWRSLTALHAIQLRSRGAAVAEYY